MKYLLLLLCFFFVPKVFAQDFRIEYKFFLLQDFIRDNNIKSIKIKEASDSLRALTRVKYHCFFDQKGRLTKVMDYYFTSDTIPERAIVYNYKDDSPYFMSKAYHYINEKGRILYVKHWDIDRQSNMVIERLRNIEGKVYRENRLKFNSTNQLITRTTVAGVITYTVNFEYDARNRLSKVDLSMDNPTLKEGPKKVNVLTQIRYNFNKRLISTGQLNTSAKPINEFYYDYNGEEITKKVGWAKRNKESKAIRSLERIDFTYKKNGLLSFAHTVNDKKSDIPELYNSFDYEFYSKGEIISTIQNEKFVSTYFTAIFKME